MHKSQPLDLRQSALKHPLPYQSVCRAFPRKYSQFQMVLLLADHHQLLLNNKFLLTLKILLLFPYCPPYIIKILIFFYIFLLIQSHQERNLTPTLVTKNLPTYKIRHSLPKVLLFLAKNLQS